MKALHRKALRDLWLMRGQALAIALIIAAGIAMLVMSQATLDSLHGTSAQLYRDYRLSDVWLTLKRAPQSAAARLREIPGISEIETRVVSSGKMDVPGFDEPVSALEATDAAALYRVLAERLPQAIVISIGRASALSHLHGSTLELKAGAAPAYQSHHAPGIAASA